MPSSNAFPDAFAKSWIRSRLAGIQIGTMMQDTNVAGSDITLYHKFDPILLSSDLLSCLKIIESL